MCFNIQLYINFALTLESIAYLMTLLNMIHEKSRWKFLSRKDVRKQNDDVNRILSSINNIDASPALKKLKIYQDLTHVNY